MFIAGPPTSLSIVTLLLQTIVCFLHRGVPYSQRRPSWPFCACRKQPSFFVLSLSTMNGSRRISMGGGPLRDGTNRRSNNRRASLGGGALRVQGSAAAASANTTPRKHPRDALLDWRSSNSRHSSDHNNENRLQGSIYDSASKRRRHNLPPPRLPPSSRPSANKAVKQEPHDEDDTFSENTSLAFAPPDYQESGENYSSAVTASSPFASSRMSAASPVTSRMASRRRSLAPTSTFKTIGGGFLSQESDASYDQQPLMSQDTIQSDPLPVGRLSDAAALGEEDDSLDHVGERSRIQTLEERIKAVEKEKTELIKSTAPLEARLRQRTAEWEKKEAGLLQEIEALKKKCQKANDHSDELKITIEAKDEEIRSLKMEQLKAGSTIHNNSSSALDSSNGNWNRHLQTNREVEELQEKLKAKEEELENTILTNRSLESDLRAKRIELESSQYTLDRLQAQYDSISNTSSKENEAQATLESLTEVYEATTAQLNATQSELAETKARAVAELAATKKALEEKVEQLEFDMDVLRHQVPEQTENVDGDDKENDVAVLKARCDALLRRVKELEAQLAKGEELRRQLHNVIQELRGNIRVFVRTRPFLGGDGSTQENAIDMKPDGEQLTIFDKRSNKPYNFHFDKTFSASAGQDQVFEEVADFVQSALDGYHVCLFSYGQTGSGKTHTMQGTGDGPMRGIIPRAVEQILSASRLMRAQKWTFSLCVSFLEIYNEELKDLLIPLNKNSSSLAKNPKKLSIKRPRGSKSYVDGLTEVAINTTDELEGKHQLQQLMEVAASSRSVAKTKMNSKSSRSHSVFMLHLNGYNEDTGAQVSGALNLCDLAGSERLDRSGVGNDAQRLRETQAINKSLSCLGDVFNALTSGAPHVPYRNSKLTYLLQDCLSGDGKALMFVNLSPTMASSNESLCSLKFAERVNKVELGKAKKNIQYTK